MYSKKQNELNSQYKKRFGNFKKCTTDINNKSLSKEQTRFRSINYKAR